MVTKPQVGEAVQGFDSAVESKTCCTPSTSSVVPFSSPVMEKVHSHL